MATACARRRRPRLRELLPPTVDRSPARATLTAGRSGRPADERRHNRHAQRRAGQSRRVRDERSADTGVDRIGARPRGRASSCCRCRCSMSTPTSACRPGARHRQSDRARAESARPARSARDDPAGEAGVLQRRADALCRASQSSGRPARQGRLQVDQDLLLRRGGADGRHQAAVRSDDRRPHRRGLLADRSDDGAVRQSGERAEQDRLRRHAAARRARAHLRRRRRHARDADRRGRRDLLRRSAADDRVLERPDETAAVLRDHVDDPAARAAGCTPATWDISTRTGICSSSIGRRT